MYAIHFTRYTTLKYYSSAWLFNRRNVEVRQKFIHIPSICLFMFQGHGCKIPLTLSRKRWDAHRKIILKEHFFSAEASYSHGRKCILTAEVSISWFSALKMIWDTLTSSNLARMIVIQCLMVVMESGWQMAKIASPILVALLSAARFSSSFFMNSYSRNKDFN